MFYLLLVLIFVIFLVILYYETIVLVRAVERNRGIRKEKEKRLKEFQGFSYYEKLIKQANEFLFPCIQQMDWGKAPRDKNFILAVKDLLIRDGIYMPQTVRGVGNLEILAFCSAKAFECVKPKDKDSEMMQALYAKEVIKGVINSKGISFLNRPYSEICDYFKTYPFAIP